MRKRLIFLGIGAIASLVVAAPLVLAPRSRPAASPAAAAIDNTEHARTIEAMRPPRVSTRNGRHRGIDNGISLVGGSSPLDAGEHFFRRDSRAGLTPGLDGASDLIG